MTAESTPTTPKKAAKQVANGAHAATAVVQKILTVVGAGAILLTIGGLANHFLRRDIHQELATKENQTKVWFSEWWNDTYQRDVQPEFREIKDMIRKLEKGD